MSIPDSIEGCPKGLEYLAMVDQLIVQQQVELLEGTYNRAYHADGLYWDYYTGAISWN